MMMNDSLDRCRISEATSSSALKRLQKMQPVSLVFPLT
jgi:hypothetical protein